MWDLLGSLQQPVEVIAVREDGVVVVRSCERLPISRVVNAEKPATETKHENIRRIITYLEEFCHLLVAELSDDVLRFGSAEVAALRLRNSCWVEVDFDDGWQRLTILTRNSIIAAMANSLDQRRWRWSGLPEWRVWGTSFSVHCNVVDKTHAIQNVINNFLVSQQTLFNYISQSCDELWRIQDILWHFSFK